MKTFAIVLSVLACASAGFLPAENLLPSSEGYSYPGPEQHFHHAHLAVQEVHAAPVHVQQIHAAPVAVHQVHAAPAPVHVHQIHAAPAPVHVHQIHAAPLAVHQVHAAPVHVHQQVYAAPVPHFVETAPAPQVVKVISEPISAPAPHFVAQAPHFVAQAPVYAAPAQHNQIIKVVHAAPQVHHSEQIIKVIQQVSVPAPQPPQIIKIVQQHAAPAPAPMKIIKVFSNNGGSSSSNKFSGFSSRFNSIRGQQSHNNGPAPSVKIIKIIKSPSRPQWNNW